MEVLYDTPIEVNKTDYDILKVEFAQIIAHREENGRYWIKLWDMRFKKHLQKYFDEK